MHCCLKEERWRGGVYHDKAASSLPLPGSINIMLLPASSRSLICVWLFWSASNSCKAALLTGIHPDPPLLARWNCLNREAKAQATPIMSLSFYSSCGRGPFATAGGLNQHVTRYCQRTASTARRGGGAADDMEEEEMKVDDDDQEHEGCYRATAEEEEEEDGAAAEEEPEEEPEEDWAAAEEEEEEPEEDQEEPEEDQLLAYRAATEEKDEDEEDDGEEDTYEAPDPLQYMNRVDPLEMKQLEFIALCQRLGLGPSGVDLLLNWFSSYGGVFSAFPRTYKALVGSLVPAHELSKLKVASITLPLKAAQMTGMEKLPLV